MPPYDKPERRQYCATSRAKYCMLLQQNRCCQNDARKYHRRPAPDILTRNSVQRQRHSRGCVFAREIVERPVVYIDQLQQPSKCPAEVLHPRCFSMVQHVHEGAAGIHGNARQRKLPEPTVGPTDPEYSAPVHRPEEKVRYSERWNYR